MYELGERRKKNQNLIYHEAAERDPHKRARRLRMASVSSGKTESCVDGDQVVGTLLLRA